MTIMTSKYKQKYYIYLQVEVKWNARKDEYIAEISLYIPYKYRELFKSHKMDIFNPYTPNVYMDGRYVRGIPLDKFELKAKINGKKYAGNSTYVNASDLNTLWERIDVIINTTIEVLQEVVKKNMSIKQEVYHIPLTIEIEDDKVEGQVGDIREGRIADTVTPHVFYRILQFISSITSSIIALI